MYRKQVMAELLSISICANQQIFFFTCKKSLLKFTNDLHSWQYPCADFAISSRYFCKTSVNRSCVDFCKPSQPIAWQIWATAIWRAPWLKPSHMVKKAKNTRFSCSYVNMCNWWHFRGTFYRRNGKKIGIFHSKTSTKLVYAAILK